MIMIYVRECFDIPSIKASEMIMASTFIVLRTFTSYHYSLLDQAHIYTNHIH